MERDGRKGKEERESESEGDFSEKLMRNRRRKEMI